MQNEHPYITTINTTLAKWILPIFVLLAIVFYQERTLLLDNAFQIFLLIQDGYPRVMTNRWPALVLRLLPWMGLSMGFSLKYILILFSISFPLFQSLLWYLISIRCKAHDLGLMLLGILILGVCDTFYWCPSDLTQAMAIVLLIIAVLRQTSFRYYHIIIVMLLSVTAIFMHPLCVFPLVFILVYDIVDKQHVTIKNVGLLLIFILFWWIKSQLISNWYDIAKQAEFSANFDQYKQTLWSIPTHTVFAWELVSKYYLIWIMFLGLVFYLFFYKKILQLIWVLISCICFVLMVHISNPTGENSFYREANYMVLVAFVMLPIIEIIKNKKLNNYLFLSRTIYIIAIVAMAKMILFHKDYTIRINKLESIMNTHCDKQIISANQLNIEIFKMNWAIPVESLLISTLNGSSKTISLRNSKLTNTKSIFIGPFKDYFSADLNNLYFDLKEESYCQEPVR